MSASDEQNNHLFGYHKWAKLATIHDYWVSHTNTSQNTRTIYDSLILKKKTTPIILIIFDHENKRQLISFQVSNNNYQI